MDAARVREIRQRAYELHLLASETLGVEPLPPAPAPPPLDALRPRQHAVMRLLAAGCTNGEIAAELEIDEKTVRNSIALSCVSLGARNRVQAALIYRRMCEAPTGG